MKHDHGLTTAQALIFGITEHAQRRAEGQEAAPRRRPKKQKAPLRYAFLNDERTLIGNPEYRPGDGQPLFLPNNRAARRARRADHVRALQADARRKTPVTELGAELREARFKRWSAEWAQILLGRQEREIERLERNADRGDMGAALRLRELLGAAT